MDPYRGGVSSSGETVTPSDDEIDQHVETFWRHAVFKAKINHLPTYFGPTPLEVVRPPAWSWGENDEEADAFVADLIAGRTTPDRVAVQCVHQHNAPFVCPNSYRNHSARAARMPEHSS